jgi:hypothetical protein
MKTLILFIVTLLVLSDATAEDSTSTAAYTKSYISGAEWLRYQTLAHHVQTHADDAYPRYLAIRDFLQSLIEKAELFAIKQTATVQLQQEELTLKKQRELSIKI